MSLFLSILISASSNLSFILLMLIVVMIAACFLGRDIVITKKMVLGAFGIFGVQLAVSIGMNVVMYVQNSANYMQMYEKDASIGTMESELYQIFLTSSIVLTVVAYIYAFGFYYFAFQTKKLRRAIGAIVLLFAANLYLSALLLFAIVYMAGGKWETMNAILSRIQTKYSAVMNLQYIVKAIAYAILALCLYFRFYKPGHRYVIPMRDRIIFTVWLLGASLLPLLPFEEILEERYRILSTEFGVMLILVGLVAPIVVIMSATSRALKEKNDYQERYLQAELEYIERYKESQTQTSAFRHDIVNQLTLMSMLADQGKAREARAHLQELLDNVQSLSPRYVTGDEMLDCIVSMKAEKMKNQGIAFRTEGVVDGGLGMKPMDVCAIFANAFDNAMEAVNVAGVSDPKISLEIKRTQQFFVLKISNPVKEKVDVEKLLSMEGYTSKQDKDHHGFGLRNIRSCVEKNEGLLKVQSDEREFSLSIMIPRKSGRKNAVGREGQTAKA